jgi:alkyl hydroperoxide reductase subunit AhpF
MSFLSDHDRKQVAAMLAGITTPVRLVFATQTFGCELCADTHRILGEVVELQPQVVVDELNLVLDTDRAARYGFTAAPSIAVVGTSAAATAGDAPAEWDPGVRFLGAPLGYEFSNLLEAITRVASHDPGLGDASLEKLALVTSPTSIQVFSTPT